ncbi:tripartite tricarboxylate transporter substrate binding protein [Pseudorhodoferax soli]|uniref:Tripartite-type tricarboxylate transporter receptor subunit TctC n=1 Tax=Pseudorhodoferax soli TaxID=545864 RepID=A0A368XJC3_9BURK|nr:tripartite tricarboxylate transporter substrate binding protein [Pseudorhodoferax soli]RCW68140.1 tripartite-type tricarboxylate transporter receptor subunit TctC [Pseudorhodoferax soli]
MTTPNFLPTARRTLLALGAALLLSPAHAWTDKPVRIVVPAPPGGTMDVAARIVAEALAREIHQPVIVDNKPGAGGAIGVQALRAAPPNGQTLMFTASNVLTEIPLVMKGSFDPLVDVKPVAFVARGTMVLVGTPGLPKDLKGLVAQLKSQPGKLSFASYSAGTSSHYAGVIFNQKAGLDLQHVPFPGSPPALVQVMAGTIPIMFDGLSTSRAMVAAGKLQVYGVAAKARSPQLPDVPTLAEQGYPELDFSNWVGLVAAGNVPAELMGKIHAAVLRAAAQPRVREQLVANGFDLVEDLEPEQMAQSVRAEYQRNAGIVKAFDIRLNQ